MPVSDAEFQKLLLTVKNLEARLKENNDHCWINDNNREQYCRNWCLRFYGISVPESDIEELGLDVACMITVYNRVLLPVLSKASPKIMPVVPAWYDLLENGHFVGRQMPSRNNNNVMLPRPIIIRFSKRWERNLYLKLKNEFMPSPTAAEITQGIERFTAVPDLTRLNHKVMTRLGKDDEVFKIWTFDGKIKFTMVKDKDATTGIAKFVYNVECILDSNEEILVKAAAQKAAYDAKNKGKGAKKPVKQTGKKPLTRQDSALNGPAPAVSAARNANNYSNNLPRNDSSLLKGPSPAVLAARNANNLSEININDIDNVLIQ